MPTIKELVTRFGFEIDDKGLKELGEGVEAVKEGVLHLGELLVGEAVGLYELVHQASEAGVGLKLMSEQTGIAVENLERLRFVAKLSNLSNDELSTSLSILSGKLLMAKEGSEEARKHFRLFGISTAEIRSGSLSVEGVLNRIAHKFDGMAEGFQKVGLAREAFGRGGARMLTFLSKMNVELDPVNQQLYDLFKISGENVEQAEKFHVEMEVLKTALSKIAQVVGFAFMPAVEGAIRQIKLWIVQNRNVIKTNLIEFVKGMSVGLRIAIKTVDIFVQSLSSLAKGIGGVKIATELLLGSFAVLSGLTILFGIGKITEAIVLLGNAFAVANVKAAAVPILIGLLWLGVLGIMEDVYSFFNGKDSFTGDMLRAIPLVGKVFKETFEPIFENLTTFITMINEGFGTWRDRIAEFGAFFANEVLAPHRALQQILSAILDMIANLTGNTFLRSVADSFSKSSGGFRVNGGTFGGVTPQSVFGGASSSSQVNQNLDVTQQFVFPPGTDPKEAASRISSSVSDGLLEVLRATRNATADGGAHYTMAQNIFLFFTRPERTKLIRTVGGQNSPMILDATMKETFSGEAEITKHPIENGADVADHIILRPMKLVISGIITETPLGDFASEYTKTAGASIGSRIGSSLGVFGAGLVGAVGGGAAAKSLAGAIFGGGDRVLSTIAKEFVEIRDARQPINIQTGFRLYESYALSNFSLGRTEKTGGSITVDLTFEQIIFAESRTTLVPIPKVKGGIPNANKGRQSTGDFDDDQKNKGRSILKSIYGSVFNGD